MSCEIMLILTVSLLAFQGYMILNITYLNFLEFWNFEIGILWQKNHKNWQILVSFWWQYSACYPQTVLLVRVIWSPKKKFAAEETSLPVQRFFLFGKRWFFLLKLVADNMVHGENLIAAKMNPDLTVCHMSNVKCQMSNV